MAHGLSGGLIDGWHHGHDGTAALAVDGKKREPADVAKEFLTMQGPLKK